MEISAQPKGKSPYRAFIIAVMAVILVIAGLGLALANFEGDFAPAHYVTVTNNTKAFVNWSCTWSNLHLSPGATGRLRIKNQPDEDYGCVSGSSTNEIDTCPDVSSLTPARHFTVTSWDHQFPCP